MKLWWYPGLLIVAAVLAAFAWHGVFADPGQVLLRWHGWRIETSLVVLLLALLLLWLVLVAAWRLLRWPFGALSRRARRIGERRLAAGLVALAEGRHGDAERDLGRAAKLPSLRDPAQLALASAAALRGESERAFEALDEAAQAAPLAARVVRARTLRKAGDAAAALTLLGADADKGTLSPGGWRELALAALATGDAARAFTALAPLARSGALGTRKYAELEARVLVAVIDAAPDGEALGKLWSGLAKAQRRVPAAIEAYARRAAGFGMVLPAMDVLEGALRREWRPALVAAYGELAGGDLDARLRRVEGWLDTRPGDAVLLTAAGRIAARAKLWSKARQYAERALALAPDAAVWEVFAEIQAGLGHPDEAQRGYRNALAMLRGAAIDPAPLARLKAPELAPPALEERDEHGLPRLPG